MDEGEQQVITHMSRMATSRCYAPLDLALAALLVEAVRWPDASAVGAAVRTAIDVVLHVQGVLGDACPSAPFSGAEGEERQREVLE